MSINKNDKRLATVPQKSPQAEHDSAELFISIRNLAELAGMSDRAARMAVEKAIAGKYWRGALLRVRQESGRGGASGKKYGVLLSSLPTDLHAKWNSQKMGAETRALVAKHAADIEEDRLSGERKNRRRFLNLPWCQEERIARHEEFSKLPTKIQERAKKRLEAVQLFHATETAGIPEMQRYETVARETGIGPSTLRNWVGRCQGLDPGDWLPALKPQNKGHQGALADFSADAWDYIRNEYFQLTKPALKPIYRRALKLSAVHGWVIPSYITVKRRLETEPRALQVLGREGREALERMRPYQERDYSNIAVHEVWVCDARKADLFCRWEDGTVSRPIVVAWQDVRSRVILSYWIARTENADAIRLAFKAAAEKARAIPQNNYFDNGRGFASKLLTGGAPNRFRYQVREDELLGIFQILGIRTIWAKPYSGRSKPIESFFRQFAEAERRYPGAYCGNRPESKPEDFDQAKAISIEQYRELLEETLADYHTRPHRGDAMHGRSPLAAYEELLPLTQPRQPTREQLRLCLQAAEKVRLEPHSGAVRILKNRYWSEKVAELDRGMAYTIRFNPEDANEPVSIFDGERFLCEAPIISRTGFLDSAAAKDNERARRQYVKSLKQQAAARRDMSKARAWGDLPAPAESVQAEVREVILPTPKVVTPLRPERDYKTTAPRKPLIERDEFIDIILNHNKASGGKQ